MVIPDAHFATSQSVFVPGLLGILVEPDGFSHRLLLHTFLRHALNVLPPRHIPVSCPLVKRNIKWLLVVLVLGLYPSILHAEDPYGEMKALADSARKVFGH